MKLLYVFKKRASSGCGARCIGAKELAGMDQNRGQPDATLRCTGIAVSVSSCFVRLVQSLTSLWFVMQFSGSFIANLAVQCVTAIRSPLHTSSPRRDLHPGLRADRTEPGRAKESGSAHQLSN